MFRIGIGHDTHRLVEGRPLTLGGVRIESERGADAHSDGDALCHALADAILGALGEEDLGAHFPDNDPQWKDADSSQILGRVIRRARERGFHVVNADTTIMLERPKLREHIVAMREKLAGVLSIDSGSVSVKAKTGEGLDAVGRGEAVTAHAIVLLARTAI
jgi:2-C-methyl-D-erythritol 2,4-cyclodiphosphate synthase